MLVPKRNQVIEWASKAWHDLSPVIVRTGFFRTKLLTRDAEAEAEDEAEHQELASVGDAGDVVDAMARLGLLHHSGRAITEENDICERYEDLETNADADESDAGDSERDTEDRECDRGHHERDPGDHEIAPEDHERDAEYIMEAYM